MQQGSGKPEDVSNDSARLPLPLPASNHCSLYAAADPTAVNAALQFGLLAQNVIASLHAHTSTANSLLYQQLIPLLPSSLSSPPLPSAPPSPLSPLLSLFCGRTGW